MTEIVKADPIEVEPRRPLSYDDLVTLVGDAIANNNTRRWTLSQLRMFQKWCITNDVHDFSRTTVLAYRRHMELEKKSPGTINQALMAIRRMAREAWDHGYVTTAQVQSVCSVSGCKQSGVRAGNWLDAQQASILLEAPPKDTGIGIRDRAILGLLLACGLRKSEIRDLKRSHLAERGGRLCIVDLVGKGNRVRTVVVLPWAGKRVYDWLKYSRCFQGPLFRRIYSGAGNIGEEKLGEDAIWKMVRTYAEQCGFKNIAPHDLRRTFGKLTKKGGANDRQIMASFGHSNVAVTERYLGTDLHLDDPACDYLGLEIE